MKDLIHFYDSSYFSPAKKLRHLSVLLSIHKSPEISQSKIGADTRLSSSMVNNYIKELKKNKLIFVSGSTNRSKSYHLTLLGQNELTESLLLYSSEIVQIYIAAKKEISDILKELCGENITSVVLYGAAETAEIVCAAIKETSLVLLGVVDSNTEKIGKLFNDFTIQSPDKIPEINPDVVLITSYARQDEISKCIVDNLGDTIKIKKLSDLRGSM